jgi:outer membrane protein, heavy metal efflux system
LSSNANLAAERLEIESARARLRQSGLRPNPNLNIEVSTGKLTGSPGEGGTDVGIFLPLELAGMRSRRVELAQAELEAVEAAFADRERQPIGNLINAYMDALTALREWRLQKTLIHLISRLFVWLRQE